MLAIKRFCDVVFSAACIIVLIPVWIIVALIVKLNMRDSVLFRQTRIGLGQKPFEIMKFRTVDDPVHKDDDPNDDIEARSNKAGTILRRTKLDELPQLFNILRGDMSFIGPRPYIPSESAGLDKRRFDIRPGLTGLAQVYGNRELSWEERTEYDIEYIDNFSLLLDLKILFRTVLVVILGEEACIRHIRHSEEQDRNQQTK